MSSDTNGHNVSSFSSSPLSKRAFSLARRARLARLTKRRTRRRLVFDVDGTLASRRKSVETIIPAIFAPFLKKGIYLKNESSLRFLLTTFKAKPQTL